MQQNQLNVLFAEDKKEDTATICCIFLNQDAATQL